MLPLSLTGFSHQIQNLCNRRILVLFCHSRFQRTGQIDRAAVKFVAGLHCARNCFSSQSFGINGTVTGSHHSIYRNPFPRLDYDHMPNFQMFGIDLKFFSAYDPISVGWFDIHIFFNGTLALFQRHRFQKLAKLKEEHHRLGLCVFSHQKCADGRKDDQKMLIKNFPFLYMFYHGSIGRKCRRNISRKITDQKLLIRKSQRPVQKKNSNKQHRPDSCYNSVSLNLSVHPISPLILSVRLLFHYTGSSRENQVSANSIPYLQSSICQSIGSTPCASKN